MKRAMHVASDDYGIDDLAAIEAEAQSLREEEEARGDAKADQSNSNTGRPAKRQAPESAATAAILDHRQQHSRLPTPHRRERGLR